MSYSSEVLADSPIFYWRLNEASGTTADDSSTNNFDGTLSATGITYSQTGAIASDPGDDALLFDGSAGALAATSTYALNNHSAITVEFWLSVAAFNNTDDMVCEFTPTGSNANGGFSIDPCDGTGTWALRMKCAAGTNEKRWTRPSTGVFHHFCFVLKKNTQSGAITGYLDGQPWTPSFTSETGTTDVNWVTEKFYFMARNAASLFLAGTLDEVAVYPSDIGAARVAAHYAAAGAITRIRTPKRLVGPTLVTNSPVTGYTVPATYITRMRHVHISNPSGSPVDMTLSIGTDAAGTRLLDGRPIAADSVYEMACDEVLAAGEIVQMSASSTNVLTITISGEEWVPT